MRVTKCLFCEFINQPGLIKSEVIRVTPESLVKLTLNPQTEGHSLIISKTHYASLVDIPEGIQGELFNQAVKLGEELKQKLGAKAYIIKVNNELYILESSDPGHVGHIHLHVIPRYSAEEKLEERPPKSSAKQLALVRERLIR